MKRSTQYYAMASVAAATGWIFLVRALGWRAAFGLYLIMFAAQLLKIAHGFRADERLVGALGAYPIVGGEPWMCPNPACRVLNGNDTTITQCWKCKHPRPGATFNPRNPQGLG